jgi:hypothetical protein
MYLCFGRGNFGFNTKIKLILERRNVLSGRLTTKRKEWGDEKITLLEKIEILN